MSTETVETVHPSFSSYQDLFGAGDRNIRVIEERYGVQVVCRDGVVKVIGEKESAKLAVRIMEEMDLLISSGTRIDEHTLSSALDYFESGGTDRKIGLNTIVLNAKSRPIKPRSLGQCFYVAAMMENDIVFGIGPAGTGKTYLAVAVAVAALKNHQVEKIILCRPAVEAGENLGFLPGDMLEKVDPYFRPLYDALNDTLGPEKRAKLQENGVVEIAPLAFMRGRTLANAYIILDEAQNTTSLQMKMLLTRLGVNSRVIITGDVTQVDLPRNMHSGLKEVEMILAEISHVAFAYLTDRDVVRHRLVKQIIRAYSRFENNLNGTESEHGPEHTE
ncbi:PhoH family protein [Candidatus Latescibacterota bacterium]